MDLSLTAAIAELESLQQPKRCEACKWYDMPSRQTNFIVMSVFIAMMIIMTTLNQRSNA